MFRLIMAMALLALAPVSMNRLSGQTCEPEGTVRFVCGTTNPEDLYQIPGTSWVIASGRYSDSEGPVYAVDIGNYRVREIFPANALMPEHDQETYQT